MAGIVVNKKSIYLGLLKNEEDAARAYDEAAILYHGEYARLNFGGAVAVVPSIGEVRYVKRPSRNVSGYTSVYPRDGRWVTQVIKNYKPHYLGIYDTPEQAAKVVAKFRKANP